MTHTITIANDGPRIVATTYWTTPLALRGAVCVSINAKTFRVLLPDAIADDVIAEARSAREVIVSRGPWPAQRRSDAVEILWDDGTDSPFALHVGMEQIDRVPLDADGGRIDLRCTLWRRGADGSPQLALDHPARYRRVRTLPDLSPWRTT